MLKFTNDNEYFYFYFNNDNGEKIPYEAWEADTYLSEISILKELLDNGFAEIKDHTCVISNEDIYSLSDFDKNILGLPDSFEKTFLIDYEGVINKESFKLKLSVCDFYPGGNYFPYTLNGSIIRIENEEYLLSSSQYQISNIISDFNQLSDNDRIESEHLYIISDLKKIAKDDEHIILTEHLAKQNVITPDKISIDIRTSDDGNGIIIDPIIEDIENPDIFTEKFHQFPVKSIYPINDNGKKYQVVVNSDKYRNQLEKDKNSGKISEEEYNEKVEQEDKREKQFEHLKQISSNDIENIIEHPEKYLDEDIIKVPEEYGSLLEYFSERVKEIGIYKPKFYPFISPYKSQWIPGAILKDKVNGDTKIVFRTENEAKEFEEKINSAKENNQPYVSYTQNNIEIEIPISDAEKILNTAKKQLQNPEKPCVRETSQEVLIIHDNIDLLDFDKQNLLENLEHRFHSISNLKEGIYLKKHQEEGVAWLQSLCQDGYSGGLLADDMGLGKTLQLLYFIEWHSQNKNKENKPYLIVAPVSLLENWEQEYSKFFPERSLDILKLYGSVDLTKEKNPEKNKQDAEKLQKKHIILSNYETIRSYQISLGMVDFAVVALDEAQKIKTPGTFVTNAVKALKSDFKIAMTGTPVENTLVDIWCIMDFAVPGLLGNAKEFAKEFQAPLRKENIDIQAHTNKLRDRIGNYIKRRLKTDVAKDLPTKHDNENSVIKKIMPKEQLDKYLEEIKKSKEGDLLPLQVIHSIKDISDHPYLIDGTINSYNSKDLINSSSKLQSTIEILNKIKEKEEKVIIFAERKETQRMLQKICKEDFGISASIINGDTPATFSGRKNSKLSRQATIDYFHSINGFNIIIMSPIAAGVGLNVVGANHIIHYSRHWNPAKEEQATDRAYRIGQEKDVFVYYPMAVFPENFLNEENKKVQSFDEILNDLLNRKKVLASNALFPTEQIEIKIEEMFNGLFS